MEELFTTIGKLYVELANMQKYISLLQAQLQEKDKKIANLQQAKDSDE